MRLVALGVLVLLLAACASQKPRSGAPSSSAPTSAHGASAPETSRPQAERYRDEHDGGPSQPAVDVSTLVEPTPKAEPPARYGNS